MRMDDTGQLRFVPSGGVFLQVVPLDFKPNSSTSWPSGYIHIAMIYDVGFLVTDVDSEVRALRPRPDTVSASLLALDQKTQIMSFDSFDDAVTRLHLRRDDII